MATLTGYAQLQARLKALGAAGDSTLMRQFGTAVVREAKLIVPRQTGNLGRSIHVKSATPKSVIVEASADYAAYVEFGTRGGTVIRPIHARVLAWGGARRLSGALRAGAKPTHFAMRVIRGATRAKPYLVPGAKTAIEKTGADVLVDAWNRGA
jgi:hypothetical protein